MRTMIAVGILAVALLGVGHASERPASRQTPSFQQTPAAAAPAAPAKPVQAAPAAPKPGSKPAGAKPATTKPAAQKPGAEKPATTKPAPAPDAAPAASAGMEAPKLPPFAGEVINFDRRGARTVACVDASKVQTPPRPGPDGKPVTPPPAPAGPPAPPRLRVWVIEREVMQELMTTGGLCDPSWSPDGKAFAAAGVRGVFTFTEPNFEPRVLVAGQLQTPAPGAPAAREYDDPVWSPSGGRIAFRSSAAGAARVEVVDVKSAEVLLKRDGPAQALRWADDRTLLVDGARVAVP
ncbi:MAG: hypothetical protein ABIT71_15520 [Vicinamibacteraceae bacterium]